MTVFMLLMHGDQSKFEIMNALERQASIQAHIDYARSLQAQGVLVDGDGFHSNSLLIAKNNEISHITISDSPYLKTKEQLSGFYLVKAENQETAIVLAQNCPALNQGDTIEVIGLGH